MFATSLRRRGWPLPNLKLVGSDSSSALPLTSGTNGVCRMLVLLAVFALINHPTVSIARRLLGKTKPGDENKDFSNIVYEVRFDNTKSRKVLGVEYHENMEETAALMVEYFKQQGWC